MLGETAGGAAGGTSGKDVVAALLSKIATLQVGRSRVPVSGGVLPPTFRTSYAQRRGMHKWEHEGPAWRP